MAAGLLDTSVLIDWDDPAVGARLPDGLGVSTISLAELAAGPHLAHDATERALRQDRVQKVEASFSMFSFAAAAARSYGLVVAAVAGAGRSHRGRIADLLIAAVAHANGLPLYTRNPDDFAGLEDLVTVVAI